MTPPIAAAEATAEQKLPRTAYWREYYSGQVSLATTAENTGKVD